jgi:hypothetical protein
MRIQIQIEIDSLVTESADSSGWFEHDLTMEECGVYTGIMVAGICELSSCTMSLAAKGQL